MYIEQFSSLTETLAGSERRLSSAIEEGVIFFRGSTF